MTGYESRGKNEPSEQTKPFNLRLTETFLIASAGKSFGARIVSENTEASPGLDLENILQMLPENGVFNGHVRFFLLYFFTDWIIFEMNNFELSENRK
jgi:hypothetical protein